MPQAPCQAAGTTDVVQFARSYHPGGVGGVYGDGSVRFLSETIDLGVYHASGTRAGGETANVPD